MGNLLDRMEPLLAAMPAVRSPEGHVHFKNKLIWTVAILILYFALTNIPLFGMAPTSEDLFAAWRALLAGSSGSNGLPIVALEVKHEKNQNVHDAVAQFAGRDHARKIFQHPFLYLAADTSDVMAATDPRRVENFRWHNTGLTNAPQTANEYPVEFLYSDVLSKDHLLEALSFFLVRVPKRDAEEDKPEYPFFTFFRVTTRAAWCGR